MALFLANSSTFGHLTLFKFTVFSQNTWIFLYRFCLTVQPWKEIFHSAAACLGQFHFPWPHSLQGMSLMDFRLSI